MRFEGVDLIRYGHFADCSLQFPRHDCDFHLILGRNEAGKSTLRQAFHDLLFGIPMNTPMSFLYHGTELELGAALTREGSAEFAFRRKRRRNGGLVDADGAPLGPDALRSWLGEVSEAFYERMFGLDHRRLEQGGRAMLQAADNVDSVLFQAASGVLALNGVLESLQQEAAALWAPRRSRDRAWYQAADQLAEAEAELKATSVRPATWVEAQRESRRLEDALVQAEAQHASLLAQVRELERLRRSAPLLAQIHHQEALLAGQDASHSDARMLLQFQAEILRLEESRLRVAEHGSRIHRCELRIDDLWLRLAQVLRQLGRPVPPARAQALDTLVEQLPPRPLRHEIGQLLQEGSQAAAQRKAVAAALAERRQELDSLQAQMQALPRVSVGDTLRAALDAVTAAGDIESMVDAARRGAARERETLLRRLAVLSQPGFALSPGLAAAVDQLSTMRVWQAGSLMEQAQRRQHLQADLEALGLRLREADLECRAAELSLEQFRRSHQAVSRDEIMAARRERDGLWQQIVREDAGVGTHGVRFETLLRHADNLADLHLQAVEDAARLQALQHEHERRAMALQALRTAHEAAHDAWARHQADWEQACVQRGLPVLPPADLQAWQAAREAALAADERLVAAQSEVVALERRHDALLSGLSAALAAEGQTVIAGITLSGARDQARVLLQQAEEAQARRRALAEQQARIEAQLPALEKESRQFMVELAAWQGRRRDALLRAGLPETAEAAYIEAALVLLADADELSAQLRDSYQERDRMAAELESHVQAAQQLAADLRDDAFEPAAVDSHLRRWVSGLEQARMAERVRSEARQRLEELHERLLQEGEGRSREQIEAELAQVDVSTLATQSDALRAELEHAATLSSQLAVECAEARKALASIAGGDAAALAEARRQEALADMAEVAERYVRLHAQQRLLERVMERYRERRQGPLLARAGEMFADLTLGAHSGLVVDTEQALLHARRTDGSLVPLEGLSDGTRDQLYLALRLAALELYLDSAAAMPFIADDLFVNYDDQRAIAGLHKLAAVARRTQVIFLTHHTHIVELAHDALGGRAHVIELNAA